MTIDRKVNYGKLDIMRKGTILSNLGSVRGINPLDPCGAAKTDLRTTRIKYISRDEIPEQGKSWNDFIFYGDLSLEIEGWQFLFGEVYPGENEKDIPIKQVLYAYLEDNGVKIKEKRFEFNK